MSQGSQGEPDRAVPVALITRPLAQAEPWVQWLRGRGLPAVAVPLLAIEPAGDVTEVRLAAERLRQGAFAAVMFVSPNAVACWVGAGGSNEAWPSGVLAAAPGPGTAAALRAAGVPEACVVEPASDAPAFDSEHLWPRLAPHPWAGREVLIVRGDGGREWLADRWEAAGARVHRLQIYRRAWPTWTPEQADAVRAAHLRPEGHVWVFSSAQAARELAQRLATPAGAQAVATHPAIAQALRGLGYGRVEPCGPGREALAACLECWAGGPT